MIKKAKNKNKVFSIRSEKIREMQEEDCGKNDVDKNQEVDHQLAKSNNQTQSVNTNVKLITFKPDNQIEAHQNTDDNNAKHNGKKETPDYEEENNLDHIENTDESDNNNDHDKHEDHNNSHHHDGEHSHHDMVVLPPWSQNLLSLLMITLIIFIASEYSKIKVV
jgi:hypothetical protein